MHRSLANSENWYAFQRILQKTSSLEENKARKDLEDAIADLYGNPNEQLFQTAYSICQIHLKRLEACKVGARRLKSRIRWKQFGDI